MCVGGGVNVEYYCNILRSSKHNNRLICILSFDVASICVLFWSFVGCTETQISEERAMLLQQVTELKTQNEKCASAPHHAAHRYTLEL